MYCSRDQSTCARKRSSNVPNSTPRQTPANVYCKQEDYTMATGFAAADKTKPYIANNSVAEDRGYHDGNATATCMCGAVQLAFVSAYFPLDARCICPI